MRLKLFLGSIMIVVVLLIGMAGTLGCSTAIAQEPSVIQFTSETTVTPLTTVTTVTPPITVTTVIPPITVTTVTPPITVTTVTPPITVTTITPPNTGTTVTPPTTVTTVIPPTTVTSVTPPTTVTTVTPPTTVTTVTPPQLSINSPLTAQQVYVLLQSNPSIVIIDTRATGEYTGVVAAGASVGHIPGAYSVPDVGNAAEQLYRFTNKTQPYICYCDTALCSHAWNVASIMTAAGYTNVTYISDGIAGWTAQGYSLIIGG